MQQRVIDPAVELAVHSVDWESVQTTAHNHGSGLWHVFLSLTGAVNLWVFSRSSCA